MKYSSTAVIPEAVADLLKDPETEERLLGEILLNRDKKSFVANVGDKHVTISTVPPDPIELAEACK